MSSKETGYLACSLGGFGPAHPQSEGPEEGRRGMFTQNALVRFAHFAAIWWWSQNTRQRKSDLRLIGLSRSLDCRWFIKQMTIEFYISLYLIFFHITLIVKSASRHLWMCVLAHKYINTWRAKTFCLQDLPSSVVEHELMYFYLQNWVDAHIFCSLSLVA